MQFITVVNKIAFKQHGVFKIKVKRELVGNYAGILLLN